MYIIVDAAQRASQLTILQALTGSTSGNYNYLKRREELIERARQRRLVDLDSYRKAARVRSQRSNAKKYVHRGCLICGKDLAGVHNGKVCPGECKTRYLRVYYRAQFEKSLHPKRGRDWHLQKYRAMARDGNRCRCCGSVKGLVVHHMHEYDARPEDNRLENLVTLCKGCHTRGHNTQCFHWEVLCIL